MTKQEIENLKAGDIVLFKNTITRTLVEWFLCKLQTTIKAEVISPKETVWYISGFYIHVIDSRTRKLEIGIRRKKFFIQKREFDNIHRDKQRIVLWQTDFITKIFTYKTIEWSDY